VNWKKALTDILIQLGIIKVRDTGVIEVHVNDGNVSKVMRRIEFK
jgi:hypothetical protein